MNLHDLTNNVNKSVTLSGWVHAKRGNNKIQFLQIRNSGKIIQVVCEKEKLGEAEFEKIKSLAQEVSLEVKGTLVVSEKSELGYEIILDSYIVIGDSHDYPITPKEHGPDFYTTIAISGLDLKDNFRFYKLETNFPFKSESIFMKTIMC